MNDELYRRVEGVFKEILTPDQFATFGPEATMESVEGWDSLSFLNVVMAIEQEFDVRIDGLDAATLISVENILSYLQAG